MARKRKTKLTRAKRRLYWLIVVGLVGFCLPNLITQEVPVPGWEPGTWNWVDGIGALALVLSFPLIKRNRYRLLPHRTVVLKMNDPKFWEKINELKGNALYRFYQVKWMVPPAHYIGMTNSLKHRFPQHAGHGEHKKKIWWDEVALAGVVKIVFYRTYKGLERAEKAAIQNEKPLYNDRHNTGNKNRIKVKYDGDRQVRVT